jgi:phage protein D
MSESFAVVRANSQVTGAPGPAAIVGGLDLSPQLSLPAARRLAIGMKVNGRVVPGLVRCTVTNNNYWGADTFEAVVALGATSAGFGLPFWALNDTIELELLASLDPSQPPASLILGLADDLEWDAAQAAVTLRGRDYSSRFIDARTSEKFPNLTGSQIATTLAGRHQMQAAVQATTTLAGDLYRQDHVQMTDRVTEWQLLTYLAEREGFDLWVAGRTLHFQPAPPQPGPPLTIGYSYATASNATVQANTPHLKCSRAMTLSRDISVTVISWNHEHKRPISATAHASKLVKGRGNTPIQAPASNIGAQSFVFRVPGLTQQQAQEYANRKWAELSRHERRVTVSDLPVVLSLTPRMMLQVTGTLTSFDQPYFIEEIERSFAAEHAGMTIRAKNASPQSMQVL